MYRKPAPVAPAAVEIARWSESRALKQKGCLRQIHATTTMALDCSLWRPAWAGAGRSRDSDRDGRATAPTRSCVGPGEPTPLVGPFDIKDFAALGGSHESWLAIIST